MSTTCYCVALRRAARRLSASYDAALAPAGIGIAQFSLLRSVGRHGPLSLTELGRRLELDRSTAGRNVRVLERQGLLAASAAADQREAAIALTPDGEAALRRAEPLWDAAQAEIGARLGAEGGTTLRTLLEQL